MTINESDFRTGMRRLAAGVSIISTGSPEGPVGITATAVTSLSAEPPSLLCCVHSNLALGQAIRASELFCVNILRSDQEPLARRFAGMDGARGAEKFTQGTWVELADGTPALEGTLVTFICRLGKAVEEGTHHIYIGHIQEVRLGTPGSPLLYSDAEFASLAAHDSSLAS